MVFVQDSDFFFFYGRARNRVHIVGLQTRLFLAHQLSLQLNELSEINIHSSITF